MVRSETRDQVICLIEYVLTLVKDGSVSDVRRLLDFLYRNMELLYKAFPRNGTHLSESLVGLLRTIGPPFREKMMDNSIHHFVFIEMIVRYFNVLPEDFITNLIVTNRLSQTNRSYDVTVGDVSPNDEIYAYAVVLKALKREFTEVREHKRDIQEKHIRLEQETHDVFLRKWRDSLFSSEAATKLRNRKIKNMYTTRTDTVDPQHTNVPKQSASMISLSVEELDGLLKSASVTHLKSLHSTMLSLPAKELTILLGKVIRQKSVSSVLLQYIDEDKHFPVDFISSIMSSESMSITEYYAPLSRTIDAVMAWRSIFIDISERMNNEQLLRHSIQVFLTTLMSPMENVQSKYVLLLIRSYIETFIDLKNKPITSQAPRAVCRATQLLISMSLDGSEEEADYDSEENLYFDGYMEDF
jgi:hypothetical protein